MTRGSALVITHGLEAETEREEMPLERWFVYASGFGFYNGAFPLTPALSLGERENCAPSLVQKKRLSIFQSYRVEPRGQNNDGRYFVLAKGAKFEQMKLCAFFKFSPAWCPHF